MSVRSERLAENNSVTFDMKAIGGYFGLELCAGSPFHRDAVKLNTGRNCLEYIIRAKGIDKIYIPYYTCEAVLEPVKNGGIQYEFYNVDTHLEPVSLPILKEKEAFLYTNYFALKQDCVNRLAAEYGSRLIVDNTQAFYARPVGGVDSFYSARKFFGVPDGAYLYTDKHLNEELPKALSSGRMSHLLKRLDEGAEQGYGDFVENDANLSGLPIQLMSDLTSSILGSIDYERAASIRRDNYLFLSKALADINEKEFPLEQDAVPMVYPFVTSNEKLRKQLISNRIYVAKYWPNVVDAVHFGNEVFLADHLIPLPVDQRYGEKEMELIVESVKNSLDER